MDGDAQEVGNGMNNFLPLSSNIPTVGVGIL